MNPFKPDDKVRIKIKGAEVEATVRLVWNDEVQVRIADKTLLWRTVKTVRPLETAAPASVEHTQTAPPPAEPGASTPVQNNSEMTPAGSVSTASVVPQNESESAPPVLQEPIRTTEGTSTLPHASAAPTPEVSSCGVPETVAERSRAKKKGRRR